MIALEQAREQLESLGLAQAASVLEARLESASKRETTYVEFLADLLSVETSARRQRYLQTRTRLAHLPFHRTLADFDFSFQPSIDERQVRELATLSFVADAANVVLLGPPGVGKTHRLLRQRQRPAGGPTGRHDGAPPGAPSARLLGAQGPDHR
jgi:DNA replication protein DnaC